MKAKRLSALLLALCMLLSLCQAAGADISGDYVYTVEDGFATITGYEGMGGDITLPDELGGAPVRAVADYAFARNGTLTSVVIPEGIESLAECAFFDCVNLATVTLPDSLSEIASDAFAMSAVTKIIISKDHPVYAVYGGVLYEKNERILHTYPYGKTDTSFAIPGNIRYIGADAFYGNKALTSVTFPETVLEIGNLAFAYTENIKTLYIPDSVTHISIDAFEAASFQSYEVSDTNEYLTTADGVLYHPTNKTLLYYPPGKFGALYTVPPGITRIDSCAFDGASNLITVHIPDTVTSIGAFAFYKSSLEHLVVPGSVTEIGAYAFSKSTIKEITLPKTLTEISDGLFDYCDLDSLTIPDTVTKIGSFAFFTVWNLTTVVIPEGCTSIGEYAFYECRDLTSVTIPKSVTEIGDHAFDLCENLTLWVAEGSYAQEYAEENGLTFSIKPDWL